MPDGLSGVSLIAAERERQVTDKGWTPNHDGTHTGAELARAAACLAAPFGLFANPVGTVYTAVWPWTRGMDAPERGRTTDEKHEEFRQACDPDDIDYRVRELAKAGALVAAEIDRLQRLAAIRRAGQALLMSDAIREPSAPMSREEVEQIVAREIEPLRAMLRVLWDAIVRIEIVSRGEYGSLTQVHEIARQAIKDAKEAGNG